MTPEQFYDTLRNEREKILHLFFKIDFERFKHISSEDLLNATHHLVKAKDSLEKFGIKEVRKEFCDAVNCELDNHLLNSYIQTIPR